MSRLWISASLLMLVLQSCGGGGKSNPSESATSSLVAVSSQISTSAFSSLQASSSGLTSASATSSLSSSIAASRISSSALSSAQGSSSSPSSASANSSADTTPAKIEIIASTTLFTEKGQAQLLSARVLTASGQLLNLPVQWQTSNAKQISVTKAGLITASGDGGTGQITARVGDLKSAPVIFTHTKVANGAQLINDNQIESFAETTPNAAPSTSNTLSVTLTGVTAPVVGGIVINTGVHPVVGRVKTVETVQDKHKVTLGLVALRDAFPELSFHEQIDLRQADVSFPAEVTSTYDVVREGDNFNFIPKTPLAQATNLQNLVRMQKTTGSTALPPFSECNFTAEGTGGGGSLPIGLSKTPSFNMAFSPALDVIYTQDKGLERFVLNVAPSITTDVSFAFNAGFDAKVTCAIELAVVRIPSAGPLTPFLSGLVTLGAAIEVSGKTVLPGLEFGTTMSYATQGGFGVDCPSNCSIVASMDDPTITKKASIKWPDLGNTHFEPSVFSYGFAKAGIGNPFFSSLRFDAFYAKLGASVDSSFASANEQINQVYVDENSYQSKYTLNGTFKAGLETGFAGVVAWLGLNGIAENLIEKKIPLGNSPTGAVYADRTQFVKDDLVTVTVNLDAANKNFLGLYNVRQIILMRKVGAADAIEVARAAPFIEGDSKIKLSFTANSDGLAKELTAFVVTNWAPFDVAMLELGQAQPPASIPGFGVFNMEYKYFNHRVDVWPKETRGCCYRSGGQKNNTLESVSVTLTVKSNDLTGLQWEIVSALGNYNYRIDNTVTDVAVFTEDYIANFGNDYEGTVNTFNEPDEPGCQITDKVQTLNRQFSNAQVNPADKSLKITFSDGKYSIQAAKVFLMVARDFAYHAKRETAGCLKYYDDRVDNSQSEPDYKFASPPGIGANGVQGAFNEAGILEGTYSTKDTGSTYSASTTGSWRFQRAIQP